MGPFEALKKGWDKIREHYWSLVGLQILIGLIAAGVGVFAAWIGALFVSPSVHNAVISAGGWDKVMQTFSGNDQTAITDMLSAWVNTNSISATLAMAIVAFLVFFLISGFLNGALISGLKQATSKKGIELTEALEVGWDTMIPMAGASILMCAALAALVGLPFVVLVAVADLNLIWVTTLAALGFVAGAIAAVILGIHWMLYRFAVVLDDLDATDSLARSFTLVRHNAPDLFLLTILIGVISTFASTLFSPLGDPASGVLTMVFSLLTAPIFIASYLVYYEWLKRRQA